MCKMLSVHLRVESKGSVLQPILAKFLVLIIWDRYLLGNLAFLEIKILTF